MREVRVPLLVMQIALGVPDECPNLDRVRTGVREILGLSAESELAETFTIERDAGGLTIVLRDANANPIGQRTLPGDDSCDALERAAMVVISAWLGSAHPEFSVALPNVAALPDVAPLAPLPSAVPARSPPAPAPARSSNVPADLRPTQARRSEYGAGLGGALSPGSVAPAALVSFGFEPRTSGWGARLSVACNFAHELELASGSVSFRRVPLLLGPTLRWASRGLFLDLDVGPALAWLHLEGHSFANAKSADDVVPGAFASVRLTFARALSPFLGVSSLAWPGTSVAYTAGSGREQALPHWDGQLVLGVTIAPESKVTGRDR